jgi:hypothetical protein
MGLLLDTHVLLWWWISPRLLTPKVLERLQDPQQAVLVSAASLWELSLAHQRGQLPELSPVVWQLPELIRRTTSCCWRSAAARPSWQGNGHNGHATRQSTPPAECSWPRPNATTSPW